MRRNPAAARGDGPALHTRRPLPAAARLALGLAALVVVGTLLLYLSGVGTDRSLTIRQALFTAVSALTVTGLSVITPARDLTLPGQVILLLLIEIGGVGFMAATVVALRLIGRNVNLLDRMALRDSLGLPDLANIQLLLKRVLQTVLLIQAAGALLLWLHWMHGPLGPARAAFYAVFHSASAFCNAGFDLFDGLPAFPKGIPTDGFTLLVKGLLIFLGGLGIPVLADLLTYRRGRRFSLHTRITLTVVAFLLAFGAVAIFVSESQPGGTLWGVRWERRAALSLFQSVSVRTAGFAGLPGFDALKPATQQTMAMLMAVGCAPASMGGGITTGTLVVLGVALWGFARGGAAQIGGRRIPDESVRKAAAILTVSVLLLSVSTWLLLLTHDVRLAPAYFEVVSAFATCGLTLGFTRELNLFGQFVVMFLMFWGRLGALTIVLAFARRASAPPRVQYPEEQLLIG